MTTDSFLKVAGPGELKIDNHSRELQAAAECRTLLLFTFARLRLKVPVLA
jgi:hypothetical protein